MSRNITPRLTAIVFAAALIFASAAHAAPLTGQGLLAPNSQVATWSAAWDWLAGLWAGVTHGLGAMTSASTTDDGTTTTTSDTSCSTCSGSESDSGWVIDPNG